MKNLKYKVIRNQTQYNNYCKKLKDLVFSGSKDNRTKDEIDLLTVLIEKWDAEHDTFDELDPIQLLHSFMEDHKLKPENLAEILDVNKGYVSEILHYRIALSEDVIRRLSEHFKVTQKAFNRPYI